MKGADQKVRESTNSINDRNDGSGSIHGKDSDISYPVETKNEETSLSNSQAKKKLHKKKKKKKEKKSKKEQKDKKMMLDSNVHINNTNNNDNSQNTNSENENKPKSVNGKDMNSDNEDSEDETLLLAAAESWAKQNVENEATHTNINVSTDSNWKSLAMKVTQHKRPNKMEDSKKLSSSIQRNYELPSSLSSKKEKNDAFNERSKNWSVHVTQISYEANLPSIRKLFIDQKCNVESIRLVYDKQTQKFRGVAFVDFKDETSMQLGLKLNMKAWKGRKINVRPTKSKKELADIVQKRNELIANLPHNSANNNNNNNNNNNTSSQSKHINNADTTPRSQKKNHKSNKKRSHVRDTSTPTTSNEEPSQSKKIKPNKSNVETNDKKSSTVTKQKEGALSKDSKKGKTNNRPLTKKDRAKKAAMIRMKVRKR